jgi:hypothetical protein
MNEEELISGTAREVMLWNVEPEIAILPTVVSHCGLAHVCFP